MFDKYKKNIFSQSGEDGVIFELLRRIRLKKKAKKWCCEFGAWDGIHGSNTFNLVKNFDYNAIYIEGDKNRFKDLLKTKKKYPKITALNKYISHKKSSVNSLDKVLKKTNISKNFEILSIDIDSYDLAVWKSLKKYNPNIVVIEINSGIVPGIIQEHSNKKIGNSFSSTVNYAKKIGYELACHTGNCIFIKKKYIKKINLKRRYIKNPEILFDKRWLGKKNNIYKENIIKFLPSRIVDYLRKIKKIILN